MLEDRHSSTAQIKNENVPKNQSNQQAEPYKQLLRDVLNQKVNILVEHFYAVDNKIGWIEKTERLLTLEKKNTLPEEFLMSFIRDANISTNRTPNYLPQKIECEEFQQLDDEQMLTVFEVKKHTGQAVNTIKSWVKAFKYAGYKDDKKLMLPAWQFKGKKPLSGLEDVLLKFIESGVDGVDACTKIELPLEEFDGDSILSTLRKGDTKTALSMAGTLSHDHF